MRCETTSSVKECATRARSGDVHVVVVSLVVDAVVGLTLGLIAHVVIVVFVVAILHRIFCIWRYALYMIRTFIMNFPQFSPRCSPSSRPFPCNFTNLPPQHFGCSSMNCELFLLPSSSLCTTIGSLMLIDVDLLTTEGCGSTDSQQLLTRSHNESTSNRKGALVGR